MDKQWSFVIPRWLPVSLNKLLRLHWAARSRYQREAAEIIGLYGRVLDKVPEATQKRRVSLRLILPPGRPFLDTDNVWKQTLDALVKARLLVDDSPEWFVMGVCTEERGTKSSFGTIVTLEDIQ